MIRRELMFVCWIILAAMLFVSQYQLYEAVALLQECTGLEASNGN